MQSYESNNTYPSNDITVLILLNTNLLRVVKDITAQLPIQEFIEVSHKSLGLHSPLPWSVHTLQLVSQVTHLSGHVADVVIQLLEMLKGNLWKQPKIHS